jgi:hypothetical protein
MAQMRRPGLETGVSDTPVIPTLAEESVEN